MLSRFVGSPLTLLSLVAAGCAVDGARRTERVAAEVTLHYSEPCDAQNRRLHIENAHAFRTFAVTVRWSAVGGKQLTEQVFVEPNARKEVGCAAFGRIIEATPTEF